MVLEPAHLLSPPAGNRAVINTLGLVRDHQILADADYLSEAAACRAGAERRIKAEQILIRLSEGNAVKLETAAESPDAAGMPSMTATGPGFGPCNAGDWLSITASLTDWMPWLMTLPASRLTIPVANAPIPARPLNIPSPTPDTASAAVWFQSR